MKYDMPRDLPTSEWQFNVPVALIMGRHDMVTPAQLAREYFDRIDAPLKAWYELEDNAHFPHFEQPDQFTAATLRIAAGRSVINSAALDVPNETIRLNKVGAGIAIGVAIGVGIGVAMDNIGVGIAIGIAIGAAIGASQQKKGD
jgi:hypothetical protein